MRVINPKFIEDIIKAFKTAYYIVFIIAIWYSLCHFITDTLGINFLDGASSLEMGSVVLVMILILFYLFLLIKLSIKSIYDYVYVDLDKVATEYINSIASRIRDGLIRNYDSDLSFQYEETTKSIFNKCILNIYKTIIEEELYNIYKCKKYAYIVIKNIDIYIKISNVDKEPVIVDYGQSLEEYIENNKE